MKKLFLKYISRNVAGMIGISVYILADTFFISVAEGADGITVLNMALPLYGLIFALGSMIGVGSATRYAIKKAQRQKGVETYFSHALLWQLIISIPFIILGIVSPKTWIFIMGGDVQIAALGEWYVKILLLGTPFFMMNYSFTAFARNDHAPTIAMVAALGASGFNIAFDYIFMFPLKMGLPGAALATAMAPVVSSLICCFHYFGKHAQVRFVKTRPSFKRLLSCCKLGISAFVGEMSSAITTVVYNFLLLKLAGNIGVAAYGIAANLALVATALFNGVAQGLQPLLSSSFGKGKEEEIKGYLNMGMMTGVILEAVVVLLAWCMTDTFVDVFNSAGNQELLLYADNALRLYFLGFLVAGINMILITYYSAVGNAFIAFVASLLRGAAAIIVCAVLMSAIMGINGVWLSFLAAEIITLIVILFLSNKANIF